jgi:hypothetical protein
VNKLMTAKRIVQLQTVMSLPLSSDTLDYVNNVGYIPVSKKYIL